MERPGRRNDRVAAPGGRDGYRRAACVFACAGGLFTQSPGYEKLLQSDYFVDLSNADSIGLRSERARHALVSVERQMPGGLVARVEGYYKRFDHLLLGRQETPEETRARLATYDFPARSRLECADVRR